MSGRTLLGLWAHPDDETYLSGGLMYEHARRGDRVVVVTATPGQHGTSDAVSWPPSRLARRRRSELAASLAALGVAEHFVLDYEDGHCADADGTDAFAAYIVAIDPDLIVTFGPDGLTGHPDHRAVSRWATEAWQLTGARAELWYSTLTPEFHHDWARINRHVGLFDDQPEPPNTPHEELAHLVELDPEGRDTKLAALRAHRSQTEALIELVGVETYRDWWAVEAFRSATPSGSGQVHVAELRGVRG